MSRPPTRRHRAVVGAVVAVVLALVIGLSGCQPQRTLTVLAAASLTESFDAIADRFERDHPGVTVRVSYGSSATLAGQAIEQAPADVFASANQSTMDSLADAGLATAPVRFATNTLQIAVPAGNPGGVTSLADFARPELRIALCAADVPCGSAAAQLFERVGITPRPDTLEIDVKATLTKVELGEVDAALVYRTDVTAAGDTVVGLDTPEAAQVVNPYLITVLPQSSDAELAGEFVELVAQGEGRRELADRGFGPG